MDATKAERFAEFLRRMVAAPAARDRDEAFGLIGDTLNAVEDSMTSIPFDPSRWQADGRMYPPQKDSARAVAGRPDVTRYRSRAHHTRIGVNGAIEIRDAAGHRIFSKPGADGREI